MVEFRASTGGFFLALGVINILDFTNVKIIVPVNFEIFGFNFVPVLFSILCFILAYVLLKNT